MFWPPCQSWHFPLFPAALRVLDDTGFPGISIKECRKTKAPLSFGVNPEQILNLESGITCHHPVHDREEPVQSLFAGLDGDLTKLHALYDNNENEEHLLKMSPGWARSLFEWPYRLTPKFTTLFTWTDCPQLSLIVVICRIPHCREYFHIILRPTRPTGPTRSFFPCYILPQGMMNMSRLIFEN
jgi:hypothetical protein